LSRVARERERQSRILSVISQRGLGTLLGAGCKAEQRIFERHTRLHVADGIGFFSLSPVSRISCMRARELRTRP
jgi:hypothetical protein